MLAYVIFFTNICCNFGRRLGFANSPEFTFALSCKQQSLAAKTQIMQAFLNFLRLNLAYLDNL